MREVGRGEVEIGVGFSWFEAGGGGETWERRSMVRKISKKLIGVLETVEINWREG